MIKFLDLQQINARFREEMLQAMTRVYDSGWYLQGQANAEFEQSYAQYIGTAHCVGCANGLDALTLIFRAYIELGMLKRGDEVLLPANTYIATIMAVSENGLVPVLVEPSPATLQIDEDKIEQAISGRTRALCIVHLYGRNACTPKILQLCRQYGLLLVEDNAQAHGCRYGERRTGSLGHAAAHSFYPGKNLGALGDGGAVTTDDPALAEAVRSLGNYGSQAKYVFRYAGRNSRLDEVQAAVLSVKLRHLDRDNDLRRCVADYYYRHLQHPCLHLPERQPEAEQVHHLFPVLLDSRAHRDALQEYLRQHQVQTLIHYPIPPHLQACYAAAPWNHYAKSKALPLTEALADRELSLPISPVLTLDQAAQVVDLVNQWEAES